MSDVTSEPMSDERAAFIDAWLDEPVIMFRAGHSIDWRDAAYELRGELARLRSLAEQQEAETVYVAVDIGCIECGESSNVLGIFTTEAEAASVCESASERQQADWHGEHSFEVFLVSSPSPERKET